MELVVDANIIVSSLVATKGKTAETIFEEGMVLFAPEFLWGEVEKHWEEILLKSKLPEADLRMALSLLFSPITFISFSEYEPCLLPAQKISPDPDDVAYFAVALKFHCPLWSNDKRLKEQGAVKVLSTSELLQFLS